MTFRRYACWDSESANRILKSVALDGNEASFMATHTPIRGFEVAGSRAALVEERNEKGFLDALLRDQRHVFAVVEGEPGSGKSHLIRWLKVNWPVESDLVVLIERADGSLDGTLRQLKEKLPPEFEPHFAGLGQVHQTSLAGRARDFQSRLANSLRLDFLESQTLEHAAWCEDWQVFRIIQHYLPMDRWTAPLNILKVLSGGDGERNSRLAQFTLVDIAELGAMHREIRDVGQKGLLLLRKLGGEAEEILRLRDEGLSPEEIDQQVGSQVPSTRRLMEALNARLNHAVQNLLGISAQGLKQLFRRVREELRKQDRRLVLLLEDVTNFQGVDDQLIDALLVQSTTQEDDRLCDLISVVGITPDYYRDHLMSLGNVLTRITYLVQLGSQKTTGFEEGFALRTPEEREAFAANYMRAVRAGQEALDRWHREARGTAPVPNKCTGCPHREPCHAAFGAVVLEGDETPSGLYPLTGQAISRMYETLTDPKGGMTLQTPRGLIQGVLSPAMLRPESVSDGAYPSYDIEHLWLPEDERRLRGQLQAIVANQLSEEEGDRFRRLIAWWGDRASSMTTVGPDGLPRFALVPRAVFEAFDLPWLGDANVYPEPPPSPPNPLSDPDSESQSVTGQAPKPRTPRQEPVRMSKTEAPARAKTNAGTIKDSELNLRLAQLRDWFEGKALADAGDWGRRLAEMLDSLPWLQMGVNPWLRQKLFSSAELEGAGSQDKRHFVLPKEKWVHDGLEAYLVLRTRDRDEGDSDHYRCKLAQFFHRMGPLVKERVRRAIPALPDGTSWSPMIGLSQLLLARAWLRGTVSPTAPAHEQWQALLQDEQEASSAPDSRVDSWKDLVSKTGSTHTQIREVLWEMIALPEGNSFGVAELTDCAGAITRLIATLKLDPTPAPDDLQKSLAVLSNALEKLRDASRLHLIPGYEQERALRLLQKLNEWCRGSSLPDYLSRIQGVLDQATKALPTAGMATLTEPQKAWKTLQDRRLIGDASSGTPLDLLETFLGETTFDLDRIQALEGAELLAWAQKVPASLLLTAHDQIEVLERGLAKVGEFISGYVQQHSDPAAMSIESVHAFGQSLAESGSALKSAMGAADATV